MRGKKFYGGLILVLLIAGVGIPALFGLIQTKVIEIGVNDLLDKSTNWDASTGYANSSYIIAEATWLYNGTAGADTLLVYDAENDLDIQMAEQDFTRLAYCIRLNKTNIIDNVDKIVVVFTIIDNANLDVNNATLKMFIGREDNPIWLKEVSLTNNNPYKTEIVLDAVKLLKINNFDGNPELCVYLDKPLDGTGKGVITGYRVELYDTKKVDSNMICNAMLAVSGFTMIIGAFAATPFWNPTHPESRTRRVLGKLRRKKK